MDIALPMCDDERMSETKKKRGRQPDASSKSGQIRTLLGTGMSVGEIAKKVGCTPALVYNVKARMSGGVRKRGPGRPPKAKAAAGGGSFAGLAGLLDAVKGTERERAQLRVALEKIQAVIAEALG
jgi:Helix-turn-helix domain of resolvase